jgi:hypothetical protein
MHTNTYFFKKSIEKKSATLILLFLSLICKKYLLNKEITRVVYLGYILLIYIFEILRVYFISEQVYILDLLSINRQMKKKQRISLSHYKTK